MECLDERSGVELLRQANQCFGRFFARFSGAPVVGDDEEIKAMTEVENALRAVGPYLDGRLQRDSSTEVRQELSLYRDNLLRLRLELAAMESSALDARARLSVRQGHLKAAKEWCTASRATA
ncbi:MAG TPA: hypothetical protein VKV05_03465 [Terriglobales bacterium]|nr:hypothetical protein [Terriglobales bacterium]